MSKYPTTAYILILFLFGFLLYSNTLNHNYVLDDFSVIKDNRVVKKGLDGLSEIWKTHYRYGYGFVQANLYRPLSLSIFALQWEMAPNNPSFTHFINVLAYAFLGVLIFYFLNLVIGKQYQLFCFLSTLLFLAHPIHTEVVANIKSLDDILAMGFSLGGIILLLNYLRKQKKKWLFVSLLLFMLAFWSKESTITYLLMIPFVLLLFRSMSLKKALSYSSWYLIPFTIYLIMRYRILGSISGDKSIAALDNLLVAAPNFHVRIATALKILVLYLWKLIFPHPLMNDYSLQQITLTDFSHFWPYLSLLIYGFLLFIGIKYWRKKPILTFGIAFYLITISLYSNIIFTIGTSFGERLLFAPSFGFCIVLVYLLFTVLKKSIIGIQPNQVIAPLTVIIIIIAAYSFKTIERNKAWENNLSLYTTDIEHCDKSARCHYYYGLGLMKEKAMKIRDIEQRKAIIEEAAKAFKSAITIYPSYSDAWGQLGLAFYRLKNYRAAENAYLKAAEYNPSNATALSNLGSLYFELKKYTAAKNSLKRAVNVNPNHLDAIYNYASTLGTLGEFNAAITYFQKAIDLDPNNATYYQMTAITYQNMGMQQQANTYFKKAKQLQQ